MLKRFSLAATSLCLVYLLYTALVLPNSAQAVQPASATLRFVNDQGIPLAKATLRLLCYATANATTPTHDLLVITQNEGTLAQSLPDDCLYLAALHQIYMQPGGKPGRQSAYTVYDTSWAPGTRTLLAANGDIALHSDWRLLLFDVQIALEWQTPENSAIVQQLRSGMRAASAYLYDLSDGQIAFGELAIKSGGEGWEGADIRIRAANNSRPSARIGGIVGQRTPYTSTTGIQTIYAPGEILTGRAWNGESAASGDWSQPAAYRTLVHEWLHYGLFLYDEYQELATQGRQESYCTCNDLPLLAVTPGACGGLSSELVASAMAYHYSASELWLNGLPASCQATDQQLVHGESDWATLTRWSALQGLPEEWLHSPQSLVSGPSLALAGDLFGQQPTALGEDRIFLPLISRSGSNNQISQSAPLTESFDLSATLLISGAQIDPAALDQYQLQIYTLHPANATAPARIVDQGSTIGRRSAPNSLGKVPLLGVQTGDQLLVNAVRYTASNTAFADLHYIGPLSMGQSTITLTANPWPVTLDVTPSVHAGRMDALTVLLSSTVALPEPPILYLCLPDAAIGCANNQQKTFHALPDQRWQATWQTTAGDELPHFGYLWIEAPGQGSLVRWFQTAGGVGPAHMFGEAPLRDGLLTVDSTEPLAGGSGVLLLPADQQRARQASLPPGSQGLLASPLTVKVATSTTQPAWVTTLFYGKDALESLGITDQNAYLVRFDSTSNRWLPIPAPSSSDALGWLATPPLSEASLLAVAWSPQPNIGKVPTLLVDTETIGNGDIVRSQIILPAASNAPLSATGVISYFLPDQLTLLAPPDCSVGVCDYDAATRILHWQGSFGAVRGVVLNTDAIYQSVPTCIPQVQHSATVFDGQTWHALQTVTQVNCPFPTATPTATATLTPSATPTVTPTLTPVPTGTPQPATPTLTPTVTGTVTSLPCVNVAHQGEAATAVCTPVVLP